MFRRLLRSTIMLAALVAAYEAYVLLAVPLMEPELALRQGHPIPDDDKRSAINAVTEYQLLLKNYFPEGHWSQIRPPRVISNSSESAMLVLDDYKRHENGLVDIERFALLVFPTPPRAGVTPPRDAIVLEAPQGAKLQFDDFHPERGQIGRITRGTFPGPITIHSDMREEGPDDDLLIETADLEMNTKLLYSTSPVRFQMGSNVGGGRELEIRFLADEHVQPRDTGLKMSGIDSLEIRRDVRMRMELETSSLLPRGDTGSHAPRGYEKQQQAKPIEVTCSGPFTFDFVRYVASLDRDVEVRQINPDGPSDQISCSQLDIHFASKVTAGASDRPIVDPSARQRQDLGRLEPAAIVAQGHPVVVSSPARDGRPNAEARGDRIQIGLRDQRVRIEGGVDAVLIYGDNVLRAPTIDYQHPTRESGTPLGRFRASGPGRLHYVPDPLKPQQVLRAAWQASVQLGRDKGQPVLSLDGRPQIGLADAGSLTADQITIYLRELESNDAAGLPIGKAGDQNKQLSVAPDRLAATGRVEIISAQLTGGTERLLATFRVQPESNNSAATNASGKGGATGQFKPAAGNGQAQPAYHIDANQMRMNVYLRGQSAVPAELSCDGNVVLREVPLVNTGQQPLEISGGQLTADHLDSAAPHITLRGAAPGEKPGEKRAQVAGRGVKMLVDLVEVDGANNRVWSDGPGQATLMVTRDLAGKPSQKPFPMEITWQGGLQFDGRTVAFEQDIRVAGMDSSLRCDRLTAKLASPVQFGQRMEQTAMDLSEIQCEGQVLIDSLTRDAVGVTSHERVELRRLSINQQTGVINGDGPGVIRSTRFGNGLAAITGSQNPAAPNLVSPPPGAAGSKLHFLRVGFHRGLGGNLYTKELTFYERVKTVYGPVDSWEQELDLNQPETLPQDTITLSCDELRLNEDPIAKRTAVNPTDNAAKPIGYIQMQARGNVEITGQVPQQGDFNVQADRASYEQAKDAFILEGTTRTPAKLWRRPKPGVVLPPTEARWIRYVRSTGEVKVDGVQFLEITPGDVESARRAKSVR